MKHINGNIFYLGSFAFGCFTVEFDLLTPTSCSLQVVQRYAVPDVNIVVSTFRYDYDGNSDVAPNMTVVELPYTPVDSVYFSVVDGQGTVGLLLDDFSTQETC